MGAGTRWGRCGQKYGCSAAGFPLDCNCRSPTHAEREEAYAASLHFDHPKAFAFNSVIETLKSIRGGARTTSAPACGYGTHSAVFPGFCEARL